LAGLTIYPVTLGIIVMGSVQLFSVSESLTRPVGSVLAKTNRIGILACIRTHEENVSVFQGLFQNQVQTCMIQEQWLAVRATDSPHLTPLRSMTKPYLIHPSFPFQPASPKPPAGFVNIHKLQDHQEYAKVQECKPKPAGGCL